MMNKKLPEWAVNMTEEEWAEQVKQTGWLFNCAECNARLALTLCSYDEEEHYCMDHCPEHKWQSTYDWPNECARCGIHYNEYLESVLKQHGIDYHSSKGSQSSSLKETSK